MDTTENEKLAGSVSQSSGVTAEELVKRREGAYECPVKDSANPKGGALGAQPNPFRSKG